MATSIGYTPGASRASITIDSQLIRDPNSNGGAIHGYMPRPSLMDDRTQVHFAQPRFQLRQAWSKSYCQAPHRILTPFRAVNHAGDLMSRQDYACGRQSSGCQSRPNIRGIKHALGSSHGNCMPTLPHNSLQLDRSIPAGSGNSKFVYDSSDYTRYARQKAIYKNYNNLKNGGNDYHAAQSALKSLRHG